jgi:hypothetical protein
MIALDLKVGMIEVEIVEEVVVVFVFVMLAVEEQIVLQE